MRHLRPALASAVIVGSLSCLTPAGSAAAHSELVSSTPAQGATVGRMPADVTLVFNEPIDPKFVQTVVADSADVARPVAATVTGAKVTVPIPDGEPDGKTYVRYRVVSADGHPVAGELSFTVTGPTPSAGAAGTTAAAPAPSPAATSDDGTASAVSAYALTGVAALLILGFGGMLVLLNRRHRR